MSSIYTSTGNSLNPTIVESGLVSGINTQQLIQAELQPYQQPVTNLTNEQNTLNSNISDYQQINSDMQALKTAAFTLALPTGWNAMTATSSDPTAASASAAAGTPAGSVSFTVSQLAAADSLVSSGSVSSTSQIVTSNPDLLLSNGASSLGFATLADGSGDALGAHTITVTQSSAAASSTGSIALGSASSGINITSGTNDTISVAVNGSATPYNLVLAPSPTGGYSGAGLLSAVRSAISSAGASGVLQAGYDSSGHLVISTTSQGSSQTLSLSGDALSTLGLTAGTSTGVDAVVNVDGTVNTLSTVTAGAAVTLNGASGATFTATLGSSSSQTYVNSPLLVAGTVNATNVSTGSGSLADVVSNINAAGAGVVASAVQTGTNQYVLQLSSTKTGTAGDLAMDPNAFASSSLGALKTAVAGQDAQIQIGGSSGYTVSSQTNTFQGLLPGLTVTAQQVSSQPVTVTVSNDVSSLTKSVQNVVDAANKALSDLQKYAGYNAATKTGGPLMGSGVLENLTNQIESIVSSTAGASTLGSPASVGIKLSGTQITFDTSAFEAAYNANPAQVQALFTQGGALASTSPYAGQVTLNYASDTTKSGSYDVQVSHSATQASTAGAVLASGTVGAGETLNVQMGSASAAYTTAVGETLTSVAQGLNAAFAAQGMSLSAQVVQASGGSRIQLTSTGYGSATSFSVSTNNTATGTLGLAPGTYTGTDIAGTINGVAATGNGQVLSAPSSDPTLGGLSVVVSTAGITSTTDLGLFKYSAGLGQSLSSLAYQYSDPASGSVTQTISGLQNQSTGLTPQIQFYQKIVSQEQKMLMTEYSNMEAQLGTLKNQSTSLAAQLAKLG